MSTLEVNAIKSRTGTDITIESGASITGTASQFKITGGTAGQAIITDGSGGLSFGEAGSSLPTQTGQTGKFLTTDGTDASWSTITHPAELPTQTSQSGKFLTTDGTNVSWSTIVHPEELPAQASQAGKFLTTDGSTASWANALPSQTGQAGEFLQTDGTNATWEAVDALPSQTGQAGEYLKTDGTTATWEAVDALPSQTGQAGEFLQTDGTTATWEAVTSPTATAVSDQANTSTGYFDLPSGTDAQRPGSPATGMLRYNSDQTQLEHYADGGWIGFAGSTPTITSVTPQLSIAGGTTITVIGINFQAGTTVKLIGTDASQYNAQSVTFVSSTEIQFATPELPVEWEPYDVQLTLPNGGVAISTNILDAGGVPAWTTTAGELGTISEIATGTHFTLVAVDPDGQVVTYAETTSVLTTAGLTLNSDGTITGDPTDQTVGASTTYNFDVIATDSTGVNSTTRSFSITVQYEMFVGASGGTVTTYSDSGVNYKVHTFLSNSTFNSGTGGTYDILLVAGGGGGGSDMGGGGGAGGLIHKTGQSVSANVARSATIGNGGGGAAAGTDQARGSNGSNSSFHIWTALGGGGGGSSHSTVSNAGNGGSGGGSSGGNNCYSGNTTDSTQGNAGGNYGTGTNQFYPAGGGGAGFAGSGGGSTCDPHGGHGLQINIDGNNYYWAGGGGGSAYSCTVGGNGGNGGGGGGAIGSTQGGSGINAGSPGGGGSNGMHANKPGGSAGANTGGGGGGGSHYNATNQGGDGGKGIIIIRYVV